MKCIKCGNTDNIQSGISSNKKYWGCVKCDTMWYIEDMVLHFAFMYRHVLQMDTEWFNNQICYKIDLGMIEDFKKEIMS